MRRLVALALSVALAQGILVGPSQAQSPARGTRLVGITFDHWQGAAGPALLRPTLRLTTWSGGRPGGDFALVFFPDEISVHPPALAVGLQAGLAQPIPAGPVTFLVKGGAAGIAAAGILGGESLFRLVPGVHGGLGVLLPVDAKSTIRLDVTRHLYRVDGYGRSVWSFGFGVSGGHRRIR